MSEAQGEVRSFLAAVAIADVKKDREAIALQSFSATELAELANRRAQTMAGFLALKRALLLCLFSLRIEATEKELLIGHEAGGAPCWTPSPELAQRAGARLPKLYLSVSHTREWAYGLVAWQGGADG